VEIFQFDRRERIIRRHSSRGLAATRIAAGEGKIHLTCLTVEAGGVIGTHPATSAQLFLVIAGEGENRHPPGSSSTFTAPVRPGSFSASTASSHRSSGNRCVITGVSSKPLPAKSK